MLYSIYIKVGNIALKLPINPEEVKFVYSVGINKYNIIGLGEIAEFNNNKLVETQMRSFIPNENTNLITNSTIRAREFVNEINDARENGEVGELIIKREVLDNIAMDCYITDFNVIEKGGEKNDVYYEISFTEWKPHEPRIVEIQQPAPIQIKVPVNETASQYIAQVDRDTSTKPKEEIRVEEEERPATTPEIIRGDLVVINGDGYSLPNNNKQGSNYFNNSKKFSNHKAVIISVCKSDQFPYAIQQASSFGQIKWYFRKESLEKKGGKR